MGLSRVGGGIGRLLPEEDLLRSVIVPVAGNSAARFLGLLFSITAARVLLPANFGLLAYGLAIAGIAAMLLTNAPNGLARSLAQEHDDRVRQDVYFSNWVVVVGLTLGASLVLLGPIALIAGLSPWLFVAAAANLLGVAVFELYREAQRGLGHFAAMSAYFILANLLQLLAILLVAVLGWRSPALFLAIYGLSSVAALPIMQRSVPLALNFVPREISWERVRAVAGFVRPLLFQTVFYGIWSGADLVLVERFIGPAAAGNYAVAKTLSLLVGVAPLAFGIAIGPRMVRLPDTGLPWYVLRACGLTVAVAAPVAIALGLFGDPLIRLLFGTRYPQASAPLALLAVGMAAYCVFHLLGNVWIGLGYPRIEALSSAVGMVGTVGAGLLFIPPLGLLGGATAFAFGSLAQLALIALYSVIALKAGRVQRVLDRRDRRLL